MSDFYLASEYTLKEVKEERPDALEIVPVFGGWKVFTDAQDLETWESQN